MGFIETVCFHRFSNNLFILINMSLFSLMTYDVAHNYGNNRRAPSKCTSVSKRVFEKSNNDRIYWQSLV